MVIGVDREEDESNLRSNSRKNPLDDTIAAFLDLVFVGFKSGLVTRGEIIVKTG